LYYTAGWLAGALVAALLPITGTSSIQRSLAMGVVGACGYPVFQYLAMPDGRLPVFPFISTYYAVGYGLPLFVQLEVVSIEAQRPEELTEALLVALLGVLALQVGFALGRSTSLGLPIRPLRLPLDRRRVLSYLVPFSAAVVILNWAEGLGYFRPEQRFLAVFGLANQLASVCLVVLAYWRFSGRLKGRWALVFWLLLALGSLEGLAKGMLSEAALPLLFVFAVYWMTKRRIPWSAAAAVALTFIVLQPVKHAWRGDIWTAGESGSATRRLGLWGTLAWERAQSDSFGLSDYLIGGASRLEYLSVLTRVTSLTPSSVPYQWGKTYGYFKVAAVPRLLWPDKPIAQEANDWFGLTYGYLALSQVGQTMMGMPHLIEAYLNFGLLGVLPIMGAIGCVYALADKALNCPLLGEGGMAIAAVLLLSPNSIENSTASTFGSLVQSLLALTAILFLFRAPRQLKPFAWNVVPQP
jgi:hypothetical protein